MYLYVQTCTNRLFKTLTVSLVGLVIPVAATAQSNSPFIGGCPVLPANHVFNTRVDNLPVDPNSNTYIAELGPGPAHPDWGAAIPGGYPLNIVNGNSVPAATVNIAWPFTSDTGPFPFPSNAVVGGTGDGHMIVLDVDNCLLYETFSTTHNANGSWTVDAISKFDLRSDAIKPANWSSANAAGTAQLPLLVRYDEVALGHIDHAISMTGTPTGENYIWPASHFASSTVAAPPMGTRFRLNANYDLSQFTPQAKVVAQALKLYGAILTDNGSSWHLQGVPDPRFSDGDLHMLTQIPGSAFEVVEESSLEESATSGQVKTPSNAFTVSPSYGGGSTQTFNLSFTSSSQAQEQFLFNSLANIVDGCDLIYDRGSNELSITNNQGTGITGSIKPSTSGTISNSQCSISGPSVKVSTSGNTVNISGTVTFAASFAGAKYIYANILNTSSVLGVWQRIGTWNTSGPVQSTITAFPSWGGGSSQTFVLSYTSESQAQEHLFFGNSVTGDAGCYVIYDRPSNRLLIKNGQGSGVLGSAAPGSSVTLSNGQCSIPASAASVATWGNTVALTLTINFASSFTGARNLYTTVVNTSNVEESWQQIGTWTP